MKRWKYIRLNVDRRDKVTKIEPFWESDYYFKLYKGEQPWIIDLMMVLGRDGWELVTIESFTEKPESERYYHFKRPDD